MFKLYRIIVLLLLSTCAWYSHAQQAQLPAISLTAGFHMIQAEVANTDKTRQIGLMYRTKLAPNHGMLFVFDTPAQQCFWMRNTLIPLSIAFIDDKGSIVNIADMTPQSDESHCSSTKVRYALEMTQGWFKERGISAGQLIKNVPK